MNRRSYIFSELGVILIGFSIYESIFGKSDNLLGYVEFIKPIYKQFDQNSFSLLRAIFVSLFISGIIFIFLTMHTYHVKTLNPRKGNLPGEIVHEKIPGSTRNVFSVLVAFVIVTLGVRQAFCFGLGYLLVEIGLHIEFWDIAKKRQFELEQDKQR